jgi:hypothetical protein
MSPRQRCTLSTMRILPASTLVLTLACGGATTRDDAGTDAASDVGPHDSAAVDAADSGPDVPDGGPACSPDLPEGYVPTWIPPSTPTSACTAMQIQALYQECNSPTSSGTLCNSFLSQPSNAACEACMETPIGSGSYGPTIEWHSGSSLDINIGGCMALIDGDLSANGCAAQYEAWQSCQIAACSYCPGGTYTSCATPAQTTQCGPYQAAASQCASDPAYAGCFGSSFETAFEALGALFCSAD